MEPIVITSFSMGLIFGGIITAAVSINEIKSLRKMVSAINFKEEDVLLKNSET
jgi:hypothetical protein